MTCLSNRWTRLSFEQDSGPEQTRTEDPVDGPRLKGEDQPVDVVVDGVLFVNLNLQGYTVYLHGYRVPFLLDNRSYFRIRWSCSGSDPSDWCSSQISFGLGSAVVPKVPHCTRSTLTSCCCSSVRMNDIIADLPALTLSRRSRPAG